MDEKFIKFWNVLLDFHKTSIWHIYTIEIYKEE